MGFSFFKTISTQSPNPIQFFGYFWVGLTGFLGLPNPCIPLGNTTHVESTPIKIIYLFFIIFNVINT